MYANVRERAFRNASASRIDGVKHGRHQQRNLSWVDCRRFWFARLETSRRASDPIANERRQGNTALARDHSEVRSLLARHVHLDRHAARAVRFLGLGLAFCHDTLYSTVMTTHAQVIALRELAEQMRLDSLPSDTNPGGNPRLKMAQAALSRILDRDPEYVGGTVPVAPPLYTPIPCDVCGAVEPHDDNRCQRRRE